MAIEITLPIRTRQGTLTSPEKKISTQLSRQTVKVTMQVAEAQRTDPTKSFEMWLEQSTNRQAWTRKAGVTWVGYTPAEPPPGFPVKPYTDPGFVVTLSEVKGYWCRITVEIPQPLDCGITLETL